MIKITPEMMLEVETQPWPDPTPTMLEDPLFEAIWQTIKRWDINVPYAYGGYCGATGNHVRAIFDALVASPKREPYGYLFQHEETGLESVVSVQQVEWGFEKLNPRLQKICPVYLSPPIPPAEAHERDILIDVMASLAAAISLLERSPKKAAPSDKMFDQMLDDYRASLERARAAAGRTEGEQP